MSVRGPSGEGMSGAGLILQPMSAALFAPFGDVIALKSAPDKIINQGMCGRHHDLAALDFGNGRAGISLFNAKARHLPMTVDLVERHPEGSQAFIPMNGVPMVVVVGQDADGTPDGLRAFRTAPGQAINIHRNVWHGVLTPLGADGLFAVVDHIGTGPNLEEFWFETPLVVQAEYPRPPKRAAT